MEIRKAKMGFNNYRLYDLYEDIFSGDYLFGGTNELAYWFFQNNESPQNTITQTRLFKYIENFTTKNCKFSDKNSESFHISA